MKGGENMPANMDIRFEAKKRGVSLWQIAKAMNIAEATLFRLLREELSPEKKNEIREIIEKLGR